MREKVSEDLVHRSNPDDVDESQSDYVDTLTSPRSGPKTSVLWNRLVLSILITETAERIAYFGFRAVLVLYFTQGLHFSESTAVSLCAATVALAYLSPLMGAVLADSHWGRFRTIWRFGIIYALGLCLLTWAAFGAPNYEEGTENDNGNDALQVDQDLSFQRALTFIGLFLLCTGTGGIKPCVSAFGADQVVLDQKEASTTTVEKSSDDGFTDEFDATESRAQDTSNHQERIREFFNSFYFCINVGALGSFALIPVVRAKFGFGASFFIPTVAMILALGVFYSQKNEYKHRQRDESDPPLSEVFQVSYRILQERLYGTRCCRWVCSGIGGAVRTGGLHSAIPEEDNEESQEQTNGDQSGNTQVYQDASKSLHLLPIMAFFPIFWMLYDQQGSVWTLQATRMNLHGFEPEQLQFLNPLEIMIFIPLFDYKIYPFLEDHGFNIQPLRRMEYGMFLTALSFVTSTLLEHRIQTQPSMTVSVAWQIPQISIITVAEILLNVTGLEFAYSQAPANMQALILALYLFMTAIGDGLAALLYGSVFAYLSSGTSMMICAVCMVTNLLFFSQVARRWKPYDSQVTNSDGIELGLLHNIEHQH